MNRSVVAVEYSQPRSSTEQAAMPQTTQQAFEARAKFNEPLPDERFCAFVAAPGNDMHLTIHDDIAAVKREWRGFEQVADCTVFQSFDWLST
jgi:CelD/BcsL family acetyltransferase involved in cellulose biosynthesis